jgi:AcrR family transcriptional regulator
MQTMKKSTPSELPKEACKVLRIDGQEARDRLLGCALRLFAEKGFARTSTREIASAAQVNISAISYYFGDKASLYRTVFNDARCNPSIDPAFFSEPELGLREGLTTLMQSFIDSLKQGEMAQNCMKLHLREMLEPTGLWLEEIDREIKPAHIALTEFLARHLKIAHIDDDVHSLAFSITGLAITLLVSGDVIHAIRPALIANEKAIDAYGERLVDYALCMCEREKQRRSNTG